MVHLESIVALGVGNVVADCKCPKGPRTTCGFCFAAVVGVAAIGETWPFLWNELVVARAVGRLVRLWSTRWSEAKNALQTLTWAVAAFGLVVALGRLKTIARLISDFRELKGSNIRTKYDDHRCKEHCHRG